MRLSSTLDPSVRRSATQWWFVFYVYKALTPLLPGWRWVGLVLLGWGGLRPALLAQSSCSPFYSSTPGSYTYTVSSPISVTLTTKGGDGGSTSDYKGGSGAMIVLPVTLQAGDQLISIVGEAGHTDGRSAGGGGGTAVVLKRGTQTTLLMASGGGGGASLYNGPAGGGGQGLGPAAGGRGGQGINDIGGKAGGGGGGGYAGPGAAGTGFRAGGGGGQASLTGVSPGGTEDFDSGNGGRGFGGGGASDSYGGSGGGGGGYGGGNGGSDSGGQGGYSFGTGTITPGTTGGSQGQHGYVRIYIPTSTASATITSDPVALCAGQSTTITGTVTASGTWTVTLSDGSTQTGTGSTFSFPVTPTSSTNYTIQCLADANGVAQASNLLGSASVDVNPLPSLFTVTGGGAYCTGGRGVAVGLSGSQQNVAYQLLLNGSPLPGVDQRGTGSAISFDNQTQAGTYTVQARNLTTNCGQTMTGSVSVSISALPDPRFTGLASPYCASDATPVTLVPVTPGGTFSGPGVVNNTFIPANAGTGGTVRYSVTVNGCSAGSTQNVAVDPVPTATLTNDGPLSCAKATVTLTAAGGSTYRFSSGASQQGGSAGNTAMVSQAGVYSVTAISANGVCTSTASTTVGTTPGATRLYVNEKATGAKTGLSWTDAFVDLQSALNYGCSANLTEIWVAAGTYKPTTGGDRFASFTMKEGVALYGGFVGNETSLDQRPAINPVGSPSNAVRPSSTTLSGDIGQPGNVLDNSYQVIKNTTALTAAAVLDGFVVTGGYNQNATSRDVLGDLPQIDRGAGMYNYISSPTIRNCSFINNAANYGGGGAIYGVVNCTISNCFFQGNSTSLPGGSGGAVYCNDGKSSIINCSFVGNSASSGGAVYGYPSIINCSFISNTAEFRGGAVNGNAYLINCSFIGNTARDNGGAIFGSSPLGNPSLINCSFLSNRAPNGGAIGGSRSLINCVLWDNSGSVLNGNVTIRNSLIDFPNPDPTNLTTTTSPFVSTTSVALVACAPAINAGSNDAYTAANGPATDGAGNPRIVGSSIDMGALEFQGTPNYPVVFTQPPASGTAVCVGSAVSVPVSVSGTGPLTYQWYKDGTALGSQTSATLTLPAAQPTDAGSYSVVVTGACNSVTSTAFSLTVNAPPTVSLSNDGPLSCAKTQVTLSATGSSGASYAFSGPAGALPGSGNTATVSQPGTYTVTASLGGCTSTTTTQVLLNTLTPTAGLTAASPSVCAGSSLLLTASGGSTGGPFTYAFSNGATQLGGSAGNTATVNQAGTYSVVVTGASGCTATASLSVSVTYPPSLTAQPPANLEVCEGQPVSLSVGATGDNLRYQWFKGNSALDGQMGAELRFGAASPLNAGDYAVQVTNSCGVVRSNSTSLQVAPLPRPVLTFSPSATLTCAQTSVTLTVTGGSSYSLSNGQTNTDGLFSLNRPDTYTVTVANASGCTSTTTVTVGGSTTPPQVSISPATTAVCAGQTVTLTATGSSTTLSYLWSTGATSAAISVSATGPYSVTATDPATGCSATATANVTVNSQPVVTVTNPAAVCAPATVNLNAAVSVNVAGSSLAFFTDAASSSPLANPGAVASSGTYYVRASSPAGCGSELKPISVTVNAAPTVSLVNNGPLSCTQTSVTLTAGGTSGATYAFRGPGGALPTTGNTVQVSQPGTYTLTASLGGCTSTTTTTVSGNTTPPTAGLSNDGPLTCTKTQVTLTATGTGTYAFRGPAGALTASGNTVSVSSAGTYTVTVTGSNGCAATATTTVGQNAALSASISGATTVCPGGTTSLTASGGSSYRWSTAATTAEVSVGAGPYSVTVTTGTCSATATVTVTTGAAPALSVSPATPTACAGSLTNLTASSGFAAYRWSTGATTAQVSVSANSTTTYSVTATTTGGCSATASARLTVNPRPAAPFLTPIPRQLYTTDFPIPLLLYALPTGLGLDLRFYDGTTNARIDPAVVRPTQAGVFPYYATQTDSKGCVSLPAPFSLTVLSGGTLVGKPADQTVCAGSTATLSVTATGSNLKYTWYESPVDKPLQVSEVGGSNVKGANTATLTISNVQQAKLYYCLVVGQFGLAVAGPIKVTVRTGCGARQAAGEVAPEVPLYVTVLGNPVRDGELRVEVRGASGQPLWLHLSDGRGRLVGEYRVPGAGAVEPQRFDVSREPAGVLLLRVSTPGQSQTVKVLKVD